MRVFKGVFVIFVITSMAVSPYMREISENYVYQMGTLVYLISSFIAFVEGRVFEKVWAGGFLFLALYSLINSFKLPQEFYYIADALYMGSYLMFFTGSAWYMWNEGSRVYLMLIFTILLLSPFVSYYLAVQIEPASVSRIGTFFNIFYMFLGILNTILIFPPAFYDRAWTIRLIAFGIYAVSEIWFFLWLFYGYNPTDISIVWLTPTTIAVLSQRMDIRRYFRPR